MSITLTFKNGNQRTFSDATQAIRRGGVVVLAKTDGAESGTFDAEQIVAVNGRRLGRVEHCPRCGRPATTYIVPGERQPGYVAVWRFTCSKCGKQWEKWSKEKTEGRRAAT